MASTTMTTTNRRRLLQEHSLLHSFPPPDFFFPTPQPPNDTLTHITLHLLGPTSTPFENGLFTVIFRIPPTYPQQPPRVSFRTKIFHPNIDPGTGDVCVDTLKRGWTEQTTLREVCIVVRCLLVCPNPESALNEEAGRMLQSGPGGWGSYERRAKLWVGVHAQIPESMRSMVEDVRRRDEEGGKEEQIGKSKKRVDAKKEKDKEKENNQENEGLGASDGKAGDVTGTMVESETAVVQEKKFDGENHNTGHNRDDKGNDSDENGSGKENTQSQTTSTVSTTIAAIPASATVSSPSLQSPSTSIPSPIATKSSLGKRPSDENLPQDQPHDKPSKSPKLRNTNAPTGISNTTTTTSSSSSSAKPAKDTSKKKKVAVTGGKSNGTSIIGAKKGLKRF